MATIKAFDRAAVRLVADEAKAALDAVAAKYGLTVSYAGGTFMPTDANFKFQFQCVAESVDGKPGVPVGFARDMKVLGLPEDCFGKTFTWQRRGYTIEGSHLSSRKYPVLCKRDDGKSFSMTVEAVRTGLLGTGQMAPEAAPKFALGTRVTYKPLFGSERMFGIVESGRPRAPGYVSVLSASGVHGVPEKDIEVAPAGRRSEAEIMGDIGTCFNNLSPENLTCDGEASRAHVRARSTELNRPLRHLFNEFGRVVSESECYEWERAHRKAS